MSQHELYEAVIGLEVHAQLNTHSKIFAADATTFGAAPNTQVSAITAALPGTLPKLNKAVVEKAVMMGLACHCNISETTTFDRKNYFYPDLPKGFQTSQDNQPICMGGEVIIESDGKSIAVALNRIHLEEDAGKNNHDSEEHYSLVDLNRAGTPLIEIVTEPVIRNSEEAYQFLTEIRKLVRYLNICDGNMEEGSLRCDANISIRPKGSTILGTKVEVKNMNSIRNVKRAIDKEVERQIEVTVSGGIIEQQTRSFDPKDGTSFPLRSKELAHDYRYFPEPDLPPVRITEQVLQSIQQKMPELPAVLTARMQTAFDLSLYDSKILTDDRTIAEYFLEATQFSKHYKSLANWMIGNVKSYLNDQNKEINNFPIQPKSLALLVDLVETGKLSSNAAKTVFFKMAEGAEGSPLEIANALNLFQDSNEDQLVQWANEVIQNNPQEVEAFKKGKKNLIGFFMGELMKVSKGKADPKKSNQILSKELNK
jgi:aspartyl-tRNA(Asn)/glutamyl-tRNA(Gln) amidotransferase subunit B